MRFRVLLIDNYDSFTYNIKQLLDEYGGCSYSIIKNDQLFLTDIQDYEKIIISPGPGLPSDIPYLAEFIRTHSGTKSILGICLGHQAIACAFGARLFNMKQACHGLKRKIIIQPDRDYLFDSLGDYFDAGLYHSWAVDPLSLPDVLRITALSEDGIIMSLAHKYLDLKGIQFHPESFMTGTGKIMIRNWINHVE